MPVQISLRGHAQSVTVRFPTEENPSPLTEGVRAAMNDRRIGDATLDRYTVARYPSFADDKTMLCVVDTLTGKMKAGLLLSTAAITAEDEAWIMARFKRDLPVSNPNLKLVG